MSRSKIVSLNEEALNSRVFSEACQNLLKVMAIVCELAAAGGFTSLDGIYETTPEIIERYCEIAKVALRALNKLEERGKKKH